MRHEIILDKLLYTHITKTIENIKLLSYFKYNN